MDNRTIIALAVFAILASGCTGTGTNTNIPGSNGNTDGNQIDPVKLQKGLEITQFKSSDSRLVPNQRAVVDLVLKNYHVKPIDIEQIELYNLGMLDIKQDRQCTPREIDTAKKGYIPEMECKWVIQAPDKSDMSGFSSKRIPIKLRLKYSSQLTNYKQALQLDYRPLKGTTKTDTVRRTYSNGEVSLSLKTENPVPFVSGSTGGGRRIDFKVDNAGPGSIASDGYNFTYTPTDVFKHDQGNCPDHRSPVIGENIDFSCMIMPDVEDSVTRNHLVSVSYKYVKAPTLDIEVVNR
ncbi:MAG: hypothetical protein ABEJ99_04555 [Candidatus Nanohaloarchaea archaeon]